MLKFAEKSHRYWLDGRPIPGVTTLIKGGLPAPALMYWAARSVAEWVADHDAEVEQLRGMGRGSLVAALKETPWTARDQAGVRGTEVHALAEQLVAGVEVEVPEHLAGHVEACVRFLDEWQPEPLVVEVPVAHREHWWAGRLDLVARMAGQVWLLDWKTAASGVWPETAFQLAAYSHAQFYASDPDTETLMPVIDRCGAVHLRDDGSYDLVPVEAGDATYKAFRHIAYVATIAKTAKDLVGAPLPAPTQQNTAAVAS